MKRLLVILLCLLLAGCGAEEVPADPPEEAQPPAVEMTQPETSVLPEEPETPVVHSGVYFDTSKLTPFNPPEEFYSRRSAEFTEELEAGDYGLLRPYYGSRAAFDMTIYGNSGIYNGNMGLIDDKGAIVVDPVYTEIGVLYDYSDGEPSRFYLLSKEIWEDNEWGGWMSDRKGLCSVDGFFVLPCQYEGIFLYDNWLTAVEDAEAGLMQIYDLEGNLLMDSANWPFCPPIFMEDGMGSVNVSEYLIGFTVLEDSDTWETKFHLYDWSGNMITDAYDWVNLSGEAPYTCGNWDSNQWGYLDAYGRETLTEVHYSSVGNFCQGQAVVRRGNLTQVIDPAGNVLWEPDAEYVYTLNTKSELLYVCEKTTAGVTTSRYYTGDFQPLFLEADHVSNLSGGRFLVWQDGVCTLTEGERSVVLEGAEDSARNYYSYDNGAEDLILIQCFLDEEREYWLLDRAFNLLAHDICRDEFVETLLDRLTGESVAVWYDPGEYYVYPYEYHILDYPGAPKLENVNILGIYSGWYMVEDEFSSGYMDADGNWLFRISLMTDMTD